MAARSAALSLFWAACAALHYDWGIRYASGSAYLQGYWASAFPPARGGLAQTVTWLAGRFDPLAVSPGGTSYWPSFWIAALAGLVLALRERRALGAMYAAVVPFAFLLAVLRLVPLSGRLSLWLVPALYETRRMHANPLHTLAACDRTRQRWRHALVVVEITVTIALLVLTLAIIWLGVSFT